MKFKHHVSNSDKNEDPLKEKSLDKALMTGQQKWNRYVLYRITSYSIKRRRKRDHSYEKQVSRTTKEDKNLQKGLYPHKDHIFWTKKNVKAD